MATVLVSEAEKVYVLHGVQEDLRCDGRGRRDVRPIVVETDIGNMCIEFMAARELYLYRTISYFKSLNFKRSFIFQ